MNGRAEEILILVVEDDLSVSDLIADFLEAELGAHVVVAADGVLGLALARRLRPDLVLLDVNLPQLSGLAVARQMKADPTTCATPLIAVTSESRVRTLAAGCDDHLDKPFDLDELVAKVAAHLCPSESNERAA
jgi:DNA-binding response OmpR family regulator